MELVFPWNDVTNECSGSLDSFILLLVDLPAIQTGVSRVLFCDAIKNTMIRFSESFKPAPLFCPPLTTHLCFSPPLHRSGCHHHTLHLPHDSPPPRCSLNWNQLHPSQLSACPPPLSSSRRVDQRLHLPLLQVPWHAPLSLPLCDRVQKIKMDCEYKSSSESRISKWRSLAWDLFFLFK